jgi:hypothetical protein
VFLSGERFDGPSGCAGGCRPSRGTRIEGNRFRDMRPGDEGGPDTFWGISSAESEGLSAAANVYCVSGAGPARFQIDDRTLGFEEWTRAVSTDFSSTVAAATDGRCAF